MFLQKNKNNKIMSMLPLKQNHDNIYTCRNKLQNFIEQRLSKCITDAKLKKNSTYMYLPKTQTWKIFLFIQTNSFIIFTWPWLRTSGLAWRLLTYRSLRHNLLSCLWMCLTNRWRWALTLAISTSSLSVWNLTWKWFKCGLYFLFFPNGILALRLQIL